MFVKNLCDLGLDKDGTKWAQTIKENVDNLDLIKTKNFYFSKDSGKKMKRQNK